MLLTIYDRYGQPRAEISPNDNSTQTKEIQGDNVLSLSFTLYEHIPLDVDDYVDYRGERYRLTERYRPKQKSTVEWDYNLKLYGVESMIKRLLVIKTVDGEDDPVFTLTAPPAEHVRMIVQCMNDGMGHITDWKVGTVEGNDNIVIDYFGKYCDEALREIAEKVGAEWWVEGQTVNICRCCHGQTVELGYGDGLLGLEADTADNVKFYTRLYPVGSNRNIDPEKYGFKRLHLPDGRKYVEINAEKYGRVDHYEESAFADIYPRRTGVISSVRSEEVKGEDGNMFTIYYFKDDDLPFDPNDYEIGGLVKRVSFQEGSELAGLGAEEDGTYYFECNYNSDTREFEIITTWPYDDDRQLPGGKLVPRKKDRYILWHIRMPDEYYRLAEAEFLTAVEKYNADNALDISVFKGATDHVWVQERELDLTVGQNVRLNSLQYFPEKGYRDSRITKIARKVNLPGSMDLEIGDALSRTSMQRLSDSVRDARSYVQEATSGTLPGVIRTWDNTLPTDNNIFSARRSQREFLSKNRRDRAKEAIIMEKGIEVGDFQPGTTGGVIDGNANAELLSLIVRKYLASPNHHPGLGGDGFKLWLDDDGLSNLEIDRVTVRQVMTVFEMLIDKVRSVGGQICVSAANGKVKEVTRDQDEYRIIFETENTFRPGDLMRCQTFSGGKMKHYWVTVNSADADGVWVDGREWEYTGYDLPEPGDECVLMGNVDDPKRQNLILISATDDGQPRIDVLDEIHTTDFTGCLRTRLGNLDNIEDIAFPKDGQPRGNGLYSDNAYLRGTFLLSTGEDIKTRFEIVEGRLESSIEAVRNDFVTDKGFLSNPAFASGMEKWDTQNEAVFFLVGNRWIWANHNILSSKGNCASVVKDDGRTVVRINRKFISQKNANLRSKPIFETNADGKREAMPIYLTFFYKCVTPGRLTARFDNVDKEGFENFNSFNVETDIEATEGYRQFSCDGLWNGTGDFRLAFTGEIYLYMLVMSTDKVDVLTHRYRTLFEQSEKLLKLSAQNFDEDGNVLAESSIVQTAQNISLQVKRDVEGKLLKTGIDIENEQVNISADRVRFTDSEGNEQMLLENGKINADAIEVGNMEAGRVVVRQQDNPQRRIEILPEEQGMIIYDGEGNICSEFTGQKKEGGVSDFFGSDESGTLEMQEASGSVMFRADSDQSVRHSFRKVISSVWSSDTPSMVKMIAGNVRINAHAEGFTSNAPDPSGEVAVESGSFAHVSASVVLEEFDNAECIGDPVVMQTILSVNTKADATVSQWLDCYDGPMSEGKDEGLGNLNPENPSGGRTVTYQQQNSEATMDVATRSKKTLKGKHFRLVFSGVIYVCKQNSYGTITWGSKISGGRDFAAEWRNDNFVSYHFANGLCLGTRSDNYFIVYRSASGMNLEMRSADYGLRVTPGGIQAHVAAGKWTPIPLVLCRCHYYYNSQSDKYAADQYWGFDGNTPTATKNDRGQVQLSFPASWSNLLGSRLSAERLLVHVFGHDNVIKASIINITASYVTIGLADDSTHNDSPFFIDIQLL